MDKKWVLLLFRISQFPYSAKWIKILSTQIWERRIKPLEVTSKMIVFDMHTYNILEILLNVTQMSWVTTNSYQSTHDKMANSSTKMSPKIYITTIMLTYYCIQYVWCQSLIYNKCFVFKKQLITFGLEFNAQKIIIVYLHPLKCPSFWEDQNMAYQNKQWCLIFKL